MFHKTERENGKKKKKNENEFSQTKSICDLKNEKKQIMSYEK